MTPEGLQFLRIVHLQIILCLILCFCASLYFQIYFSLLFLLPAKETTLINCYDWQGPHPHLLFTHLSPSVSLSPSPVAFQSCSLHFCLFLLSTIPVLFIGVSPSVLPSTYLFSLLRSPTLCFFLYPLPRKRTLEQRVGERRRSCLGKDMMVVNCDWCVGAVLILALNLHDARAFLILQE